MDLNDFGTHCDANARPPHHDSNPYAGSGIYGSSETPMLPIQWKLAMPGVFESCGTTFRKLPAGAYGCSINQYGEPQLVAKDLQVDDLIDFADSLPSQILQEIENFWSLGEKFERYGYLHRRGYLLYGPQGSGKSSVVHQVVHRIIKAGHVAVFCEHPGVLTRTMELFRKVEVDRPLICMFEDIDAVIELHGDSELLQWLDGSHQINKVINIATTNYPERLDRRIVSRPRRFDRIIKIEAPAAHIARPSHQEAAGHASRGNGSVGEAHGGVIVRGVGGVGHQRGLPGQFAGGHGQAVADAGRSDAFEPGI